MVLTGAHATMTVGCWGSMSYGQLRIGGVVRVVEAMLPARGCRSISSGLGAGPYRLRVTDTMVPGGLDDADATASAQLAVCE